MKKLKDYESSKPDAYWVHASQAEWSVERERRLAYIAECETEAARAAKVAVILGAASGALLLLSALLRVVAG